MNDDKSNNKVIKEENNGIPLAIKFLSNVNFINCLRDYSCLKLCFSIIVPF